MINKSNCCIILLFISLKVFAYQPASYWTNQFNTICNNPYYAYVDSTLYNAWDYWHILSQTAENTLHLSSDKKKRYLGIEASYRFTYMDSNIDWEYLYNNCYKCKVGYSGKSGYKYLIDLENYEEKELIKERNISSYINKGYSVGLNYFSQIKNESKFYYDLSINFVNHGKYYYSHIIERRSGVSVSYLYTYIPIVYYIAEINTIDITLKINYNINLISDKFSIMPFTGLNRSQFLFTLINAYEFEGNRYIGKFKRDYYKDKYENDFKNILFDRAYQLNHGVSLNLKVKNKIMLMMNYTYISSSIKVWEKMLKGERGSVDSITKTGYMLLHNVNPNIVSANFPSDPKVKPINVFELRVLCKI